MSNLYGVPRDQYSVQSYITFLSMTFLKLIHNRITITTIIYADDVQLLYSGAPNNLEPLKIHAETSLKTMQEWYSKNGLKMNSNKTQCIFCNTKFQQTD